MNGLLRCAIISDSERGVLASSRIVALSVTRLDTLLLPGLVNRLLTHCRLIYRASLHTALLVNLNFISSVPPFSSSHTSSLFLSIILAIGTSTPYIKDGESKQQQQRLGTTLRRHLSLSRADVVYNHYRKTRIILPLQCVFVLTLPLICVSIPPSSGEVAAVEQRDNPE